MTAKSLNGQAQTRLQLLLRQVNLAARGFHAGLASRAVSKHDMVELPSISGDLKRNHDEHTAIGDDDDDDDGGGGDDIDGIDS